MHSISSFHDQLVADSALPVADCCSVVCCAAVESSPMMLTSCSQPSSPTIVLMT